MSLTQKRLKELLHYNPGTGDFTWIAKTSSQSRIHIGDVAGCKCKDGRVTIQIDSVLYKAHRLAWLYVKGVWPTFEIDHKDTDPSNNRWKNLRDVTRIINAQNQRKAQRNNKIGMLGVDQDTRPGRKGFRASIGLNKKKRPLGTYPTPLEAHIVYLDAKRELHPGCTI